MGWSACKAAQDEAEFSGLTGRISRTKREANREREREREKKKKREIEKK